MKLVYGIINEFKTHTARGLRAVPLHKRKVPGLLECSGGQTEEELIWQ